MGIFIFVMPRDQKGPFKKTTDDSYQKTDDEGFKLSFRFPSLKALLNWIYNKDDLYFKII